MMRNIALPALSNRKWPIYCEVHKNERLSQGREGGGGREGEGGREGAGGREGGRGREGEREGEGGREGGGGREREGEGKREREREKHSQAVSIHPMCPVQHQRQFIFNI